MPEVGGIEVVFPGDAHEREQSVAARIGECRAHALRVCCFGNRANRPIRRDPLAGGVGQHGRELDHAGRLIDGGGLYGGDLVLAERLAHDVEPAGERRVAKAALAVPWPAGPDGTDQRLFRVDEFGLSLGQG